MSLLTRKTWYSSLQSIRGISVIAVVLFHLNETLFSGGYLGVDIFFTISGFVVLNSVLVKVKNNKFSFNDFFYKRFMRLQPAALVCIIFSLIMAIIFLLPFGTKSSFLGGIFSSLGIMNFWLLRISQDYFASPSDHNLFMQFWSLSIEEQYYLIFAIILSFANSLKKIYLIDFFLMILTTSSISFFVFSSYSFSNPFLYFNTFGRIWEIALGALVLSFADQLIKYSNIRKFLEEKDLLSNIFLFRKKINFNMLLIILLIPILFLGQPSKIWVLGLTFFTALYLFFLRFIDNFLFYENSKISNQMQNNHSFSLATFLEKIGEISYSIYLWHWPIFYLFKMYFPIYYSNPFISYSVLILIVFIFGKLSHKYLELKFRV